MLNKETAIQIWVIFYSKFLPAAFVFVILVLAGVVIEKILTRGAEKLSPEKAYLVRFMGRAAKYILAGIGAISGLGTLGVNISAIIAGLGLTGFAVGLALKDAISNLIAGVMVIIYAPFTAGDRITVAGKEGVVKELNLRYMTLELEDGSCALIPNSKLLTETVVVKRREEKK